MLGLQPRHYFTQASLVQGAFWYRCKILIIKMIYKGFHYKNNCLNNEIDNNLIKKKKKISRKLEVGSQRIDKLRADS